MSIAIETSGLTKRYGDRPVVDHLDLRLESGAVHGFVGPNGAGKTTTIRMLLGLVRPDSGSGTVLGAPLTQPAQFLPRVGAMIEGPAFHASMSGRNNLRILAAAGDIHRRRVDEVLDIVGLTAREGDRVASYSLGMRQRLGIAAALLPQPDLLILDEPTNGLDPAGIRDMRQLLRLQADRGATVMVSSHLLGELQSIADHIVLVDNGQLRSSGPIGELPGTTAHTLVRPEHPVDLDEVIAISAQLGANPIPRDGYVLIDADTDIGELNRAALRAGVTLVEITRRESSLEDVFFAVTQPIGSARTEQVAG